MEPKTETRAASNIFPVTQYIPLLASAILTLLTTSTLFLIAPQGLGAWLVSLPEYFAGWVGPLAVPASRLFLALGVYQLLGILFAVAAILRGWWDGDRRAIRLSLWMLVALLLAAFYPTRQTADLVWMLIPLWILAASELARHLDIIHEDRLETAGVMIFTVLLLAFAWMDLNALSLTAIPSQHGTVRMALFFGALLLLILSVVLVGFGWSANIARVGTVWGVIIILSLYTLGAAWGATGLRNRECGGTMELVTTHRAGGPDLTNHGRDLRMGHGSRGRFDNYRFWSGFSRPALVAPKPRSNGPPCPRSCILP